MGIRNIDVLFEDLGGSHSSSIDPSHNCRWCKNCEFVFRLHSYVCMSTGDIISEIPDKCDDYVFDERRLIKV